MLTILSVAILFFNNIAAAAAGAADPPALDISGNQLEAGVWYYMLPIQKRVYRGFFSGAFYNTTCPIYINEAPKRFPGIAAKFWPVDGGSTVRMSTDLNVEFFETNQCPEKAIWTLAPRDEARGQRFVRYGGVIGSPGPNTLNNWFRIEKDGDFYNLKFCPLSVCNTCKDVVCGVLGIYTDAFNRWLVLEGQRFSIKFKKFRPGKKN
ncbi:unnamed protein product [Victoria cruziana]